MRRFSFRLQSILDLRRKEVDQRRLELGAKSQRCASLQREIDDRRARRRAVLTERHAAGTPGGSDLAFWQAAEAYAVRMEQEARRIGAELADAEKERAAAADAYRAARQKADVLERLRERREAAYVDAQKKDEQHRLDEVAQRMAAGVRE